MLGRDKNSYFLVLGLLLCFALVFPSKIFTSPTSDVLILSDSQTEYQENGNWWPAVQA